MAAGDNRITNAPRNSNGQVVLDGRKTRYMTASGQQNALSKRESVAMMHEKVTGLRDNSSVYLVGVDRTQGIALDEIFGKKVVD